VLYNFAIVTVERGDWLSWAVASYWPRRYKKNVAAKEFGL
jgi:hypothetical protein